MFESWQHKFRGIRRLRLSNDLIPGMSVLQVRAFFPLLLLLGLALGLSSCGNDTAPTTPPNTKSSDSIFHFQLPVANLHKLDPAYEQYVLWLKIKTNGTAVWTAFKLTTPYLGNSDSLKWLSDLILHISLDSIVRVALSIEPPVIPAVPSSKLIAGTFVGGTSNTAVLTASDSDGAGDYSSATGSVLFTTKSSDTNWAKSEFYLMRVNNGTSTASVQNLPVPRAGWVYALWVLDSNYYPLHKFFYGSFTDAAGPDSDPTNDEYPFPGGYKPAALNDPGAMLEITLQPSFEVQNSAPSAPSPIPVLWLQLQRFIDFNQSLDLQNAWQATMPSGTIKIYQ